jgi:Protein of unknown function (DUF3703)
MNNFANRIDPFVRAEINLASSYRMLGNIEQEFHHLERAHVLGQGSTRHHVRVHFLMLLWGLRQLRAKEILGQITRIIGASTKTAFGWIPSGNTGGSNVSPFKSLPVSDDLKRIITQAQQ